MPARRNRPDKFRSNPLPAAPPPSKGRKQTEPEDSEDHPLLAQVRPLVVGKTALFIGNRSDPLLKARLEGNLGLRLTWCEGNPRQVQAHCSSIARHGFDLVLLATGFQGHQVDGVLSHAARSGGVPYVRVFKGRALACVLAIARTFGLAETAA